MRFLKNLTRKAKSIGSGLVRNVQQAGRSVSNFINKSADTGGKLIDSAKPIADKILTGADIAGSVLRDYGGSVPVVGDLLATGGTYLAKGSKAGRKALASGIDAANRGIGAARSVSGRIDTANSYVDNLEPPKFKMH